MSGVIDRQTAANELIAMRKHIDADMSIIGREAYEMAIKALRESERKPGRWIKTINANYSPFDNSGEYIGTCSECGYEVNLEDGGIYSFCSACGAPMTEGEQDGHR